MRTWIFLLLAALAGVCGGQQDCSRGACYPPLGELLIGRERQLRVSSTCGLTETEVYCTPFGQFKMKCCPCDSRIPAGPNAHPIQNVLPHATPDKWWQSKKDVSPVTLQLDLQQMFHVDNLMLSFKAPRPKALVIERTKDFGRTWRPVLYMATDCSSAFPWVTKATPRNLEDTYCYSLPTTSPTLYQDQRIYYHPLNQHTNINSPKEHKIEELSGFTGLRVNLTQFGDVLRLPGRSPSQFYALKELKVTGSCFCHGHANRCLPDPNSNYLPTVQVNGVCECQHNTAGLNCEHCDEMYNDLPWRPAERDNTHTCKRCECNNHAVRCHFDRQRYELSGRRSGGVCDGCLHNTVGPHCEHCAPNYYRNPNSNMQRPDACLPCQCEGVGSVNGRQCDSVTGQCVCKANVEGTLCDRCKAGYYDLNAANPLGCSQCSCSPTGSLHSVCNAVTGQCACRPNVQGISCDRCALGFWMSPFGCQPCNCDPNNSLSSICNQETGQCRCQSGFFGQTCRGCPDNTYGDALTGCRPCQCDKLGTAPAGCDKLTGACRCKPGVTGPRCDACARGHCASFPQCPACPSCFVTLDDQLQNLTFKINYLATRLASEFVPSSGEVSTFWFLNLEDTLRQIQRSLRLPLRSEAHFTEDQARFHTLRLLLATLNSNMQDADPTPELQRELDVLQTLLSRIQLIYNVKNNASSTFSGSNNTDALAAIRNAYDTSMQAEKRADATGNTVNKSADIRDNDMERLDKIQPPNTKILQRLEENLATWPNLTTAAIQICGKNLTSSCTPKECDEELCPAGGVPPCDQGKLCTGALSQAIRAAQDADEVKMKLQQLNNNITETYSQIQQTQDSASRVRLSTDELAQRIKVTRDDVDYELKNLKDFVKKLKDYLSDPSSDPTEVQRVSEAVLGMKLPEGAESLRKKLQDLQDLASSLPNSSKVLEEVEPKLEQARRLLQDAEKARNESLFLQDDADKMLKKLNISEDSMKKMEQNLKQSLDIVNTAKDDVQKVNRVLAPLEDWLTKDTALLGSLLKELKDEVKMAENLAGTAEQQAGGAQLEATLAATELKDLQDQLEKLKENANASSAANTADQRLQALQQNATDLAQETVDMMKRLTDKERSLQNATQYLLENSPRLAGLEAELQEIITSINEKATYLTKC